jgi:N-acyl-D-aspartate/D-glutamate deacylase
MPRILAEFVRRRGVLSLAEAIHRMTALAAARFGLANRGRLAEGAIADLVLFRPDSVEDVASYDDPKREASGIDLVVVAGEVALDNGHHTGVRRGRALRADNA